MNYLFFGSGQMIRITTHTQWQRNAFLPMIFLMVTDLKMKGASMWFWWTEPLMKTIRRCSLSVRKSRILLEFPTILTWFRIISHSIPESIYFLHFFPSFPPSQIGGGGGGGGGGDHGHRGKVQLPCARPWHEDHIWVLLFTKSTAKLNEDQRRCKWVCLMFCRFMKLSVLMNTMGWLGCRASSRVTPGSARAEKRDIH